MQFKFKFKERSMQLKFTESDYQIDQILIDSVQKITNCRWFSKTSAIFCTKANHEFSGRKCKPFFPFAYALKSFAINFRTEPWIF